MLAGKPLRLLAGLWLRLIALALGVFVCLSFIALAVRNLQPRCGPMVRGRTLPRPFSRIAAPTRAITRVGARSTHSHLLVIAVAAGGLRPVCKAVSRGLFTLATAASTVRRTQC